ncbi:MAG: rhodanese-like domain-containing protein [Gemmatimonadaceae bacterium]|nr:rhodanese-like domain-containing protein [Gemmatimonadaceae bacterium]
MAHKPTAHAAATVATFRGRKVDLVVDVRSRIEFWLGHLDGAVCIPVGSVARRLADDALDRKACILVYCASGARSAAAAQELRAAGYGNVVDGGGMGEASQHFTRADVS